MYWHFFHFFLYDLGLLLNFFTQLVRNTSTIIIIMNIWCQDYTFMLLSWWSSIQKKNFYLSLENCFTS